MYNYNFELAALAVMVLILVHFVINRQIPVVRTKVFLIFIIVSLFTVIMDIASCIGCEYATTIPLWLNQLFAFCVFWGEALCSYVFFTYVIQVCGKEYKWRRNMLITGVVPTGILLLVTFLTPFTGWLYYFDAEYVYRQGPLNWLGFVTTFGYVLIELFLMGFYRKRMKTSNQIAIVVYFAVALVAVFVQYYNREVLLNGILRTFVILIIYLAVQNPGNLIDGVTGRYNELAFRTVVIDKLNRGKGFVVLQLHLNKFNNVSTVIGYKNVDNILAQVGDYLADLCGEENTYRTESHVFSMILTGDEIETEYKISVLQARFEQKWRVENMDLLLYENLVMAKAFAHFETVSEMSALLEYMMEQAKSRGSNSLVAADEDIRADFIRLNKVERAIERAVQNNSLEVHFQPIYSVKEKRLVAAEALARMTDEELGNVPPLEFIPVAEKNGTIIELGKQIFEKCCRFIVEELVPHPELGIGSIHINLSVVQCIQPDMAEQLIRLLEIYKVPPGMINLELTERITLGATNLMRTHMQKLAAYGVKFSLDDYGTGSSNCAYLIDYDFGMVKFDKKMMDSYFENRSAFQILDNEFRTLRNLGISIVAEGIETAEQVQKLEEVDMNYIQGYFFARPAPAEQFIHTVRQQVQTG